MSGRQRAALLLILLLVGIGGLLAWRARAAEPWRRTTRAGDLTVTLTMDTAAVGRRDVVVELRDDNRRAVDADRVALRPTMAEMGHALPEAEGTAVPSAPGRYRVIAVDFFMPGEWEIDVDIRRQGHAETARFALRLT